MSKGSRRSPRIQTLLQQIIELASTGNVDVALYSLKQVISVFFGKRNGTKQDIAQLLAKRFPEELGARLPPKRRPWMSEDYRMGIFDAVALGFTHIQKRGKRRNKLIAPGSLKWKGTFHLCPLRRSKALKKDAKFQKIILHKPLGF